MPQLVKGGKYIFGWVRIKPDGRIRIPDEAFHEYDFQTDKKILLLPGSKTSGGFCLIKPETMEASRLGQQLTLSTGYSNGTNSFDTDSSLLVRSGKILLSWTKLDHQKHILVSAELLACLGLKAGDRLLVGRGSIMGPAFIARGFIFTEALKHGQISTF